MLLNDKITELLNRESSIFEANIDDFITYLKFSGIARTKVLIQIDILFHLLNQQFSYNYINRELYKKLNHILEVTTALNKTNYPEEISTPSTPTITTSVPSLAFGNVTIGQSSTLSFTVTGTDLTTLMHLTTPAKIEVSLDSVNFFKSVLGIVPLTDSIVNTIYVKYTPTTAVADSGDIVIGSTGATNALVSYTGTGVTP